MVDINRQVGIQVSFERGSTKDNLCMIEHYTSEKHLRDITYSSNPMNERGVLSCNRT